MKTAPITTPAAYTFRETHSDGGDETLRRITEAFTALGKCLVLALKPLIAFMEEYGAEIIKALDEQAADAPHIREASK